MTNLNLYMEFQFSGCLACAPQLGLRCIRVARIEDLLAGLWALRSSLSWHTSIASDIRTNSIISHLVSPRLCVYGHFNSNWILWQRVDCMLVQINGFQNWISDWQASLPQSRLNKDQPIRVDCSLFACLFARMLFNYVSKLEVKRMPAICVKTLHKLQ